MKKLIFAAATAAALVGMADIESTNVVGYGFTGLKTGATMCAPMFIETGSTGDVSIKSMVPNGEDLDVDGGIYVQTLDAFGRTLDTYSWMDIGEGFAAWYNEDFELADVIFQAGQGLWTTAINSQTSLQSAGEVNFKDCSVQLKTGATGTGNMTPVAINVQDLLIEGEEIDVDGGIYIQTLDAFGRTLDTYSWMDIGEGFAAWYNEDFELADVDFTPGQGLWITAVNSDTYIRFPAPESK